VALRPLLQTHLGLPSLQLTQNEATMEKKQGKRYNAEFKARTIALLRTSDKPLSQIGRDLGVPACTLKWWLEVDRGRNGMPTKTKTPKGRSRVEDLEAEVQQLRKALKQAEMEREILKRAATWFAKESE
jgi:transposase